MLLRGFYFIPTRWHHCWMKGFLIFPVLLILLFGTPAFADFAKGLDAYHSGDYATALKEWVPLAEQGDSSAQLFLGLMYLNELGVIQDYKVAFKWFRLAAEQGDATAQRYLGWMYGNGQGVTQDHKASVMYSRLSAEQGDAVAQFDLGLIYYNGLGVVQHYIRAHMWWNIAASQGDKLAVKNRDIVAKEMTSSQIAEAQNLARECVAKNYKGC